MFDLNVNVWSWRLLISIIIFTIKIQCLFSPWTIKQDPIIFFIIYSRNKCFYIIAYLTLTLGPLERLIDINHVCKYPQYPIIGSWYIVKKSFKNLRIWPWPLNLWPWPWVYIKILLISIMCVSTININSLVHDL